MVMDSKSKNVHTKGISLRLIGLLMSIFAIIVSGALIASLWLISYENNVVTKANENYIALKQASSDIQSASDDLTNDARLFVALPGLCNLVFVSKQAHGRLELCLGY